MGAMKLKNILVVVKDIEKSKQFYKEVFGLTVVRENDGNVILTEGLVLQDERIWQDAIGKEIRWEHHACELYFEEGDIESFAEKLERLYPSVKYLNHLSFSVQGQGLLRFYDLDGNLIEVRTPI